MRRTSLPLSHVLSLSLSPLSLSFSRDAHLFPIFLPPLLHGGRCARKGKEEENSSSISPMLFPLLSPCVSSRRKLLLPREEAGGGKSSSLPSFSYFLSSSLSLTLMMEIFPSRGGKFSSTFALSRQKILCRKRSLSPSFLPLSLSLSLTHSLSLSLPVFSPLHLLLFSPSFRMEYISLFHLLLVSQKKLVLFVLVVARSFLFLFVCYFVPSRERKERRENRV